MKDTIEQVRELQDKVASLEAALKYQQDVNKLMQWHMDGCFKELYNRTGHLANQ